jgi:hypothetical protein
LSAIVDFLEGSGVDRAGRLVTEVLGFGLGPLESRHDFIQWLFPLSEPSAAAPGSPVLEAEDIAAIRASPAAQTHLEAARERMGWFYDQTDHWLRPGDHNQRRITRIIKSLRLLVGDAAADQFRGRILAKANRLLAPVDATTRRYWHEA